MKMSDRNSKTPNILKTSEEAEKLRNLINRDTDDEIIKMKIKLCYKYELYNLAEELNKKLK